MTDDRIRQLWGDDLRTLAPAALAAAQLSADDRSFLAEVGLPIEAPLGMSFAHDMPLESLTLDGAEYVKIGDTYEAPIGIEIGTNDVWLLAPDADPETDFPRRFANSSVRDFIAFLGIYRATQSAATSVSEEEAGHLVDELRNQFEEVDPAALADEENCWSVVLEQTADGLL